MPHLASKQWHYESESLGEFWIAIDSHNQKFRWWEKEASYSHWFKQIWIVTTAATINMRDRASYRNWEFLFTTRLMCTICSHTIVASDTLTRRLCTIAVCIIVHRFCCSLLREGIELVVCDCKMMECVLVGNVCSCWKNEMWVLTFEAFRAIVGYSGP